MATTGFGFLPVRSLHGGQLRVRTYYVPSTNSTAMAVGDLVKLAGTTALDSAEQVITIDVATAGAGLLGTIVGFLPDPTQPYNGFYRPASTARYVLVADDDTQIMQAQEDAVGGVISAAHVAAMYNVSVITAAAVTSTGTSGHMIDSSTAVTSSLELKLVGSRRDKVNAAAQTGGAVLECRIHISCLLEDNSAS